MTDATDHLVIQRGLMCHCGITASRWTRCRRCQKIVARCGSHGQNMVRETEGHCR